MTEIDYSDASRPTGGSGDVKGSLGDIDLPETGDWNNDLGSDEVAQIAVSGSPGHITVRGELDFDSADRFRAAIAEAVSPDVPELVLDMSEVTFMDSSGLRELAYMRSAGFKITIENASECVQTLLRVTRMDEVFSVS